MQTQRLIFFPFAEHQYGSIRLYTAKFQQADRYPVNIDPADPYQPGGLLSLGKPGLIDKLFREAGLVRALRLISTTRVSRKLWLKRLPKMLRLLNWSTHS